MFGKLFRPSSRLLSSNQASKRLRELHEYLCLREAAKPEVSKAMLNDLQKAAKQYNITSNQVTEIATFLNYDPVFYSEYFKGEDYPHALEYFDSLYRNSNVYESRKNYAEFQRDLEAKYPQLVAFTKLNAERTEALNTLEAIFVKDGPNGEEAYNNQAVRKYIPTFAERIKTHLNNLQGQIKTTNKQTPEGHPGLEAQEGVNEHIKKIFDGLLIKLELRPSLFYGQIRAFIDIHKSRLGAAVPRAGTEINNQSRLRDTVLTSAQTEVIPAEGIDDVPAIVEETTQISQKKFALHVVPWIDNKKVIFEAQPIRNNWRLWGAVSITTSLGFLYDLAIQEYGPVTLAAFAAIALYAARQANRTLAFARFDKLVQINLHRDGKYVDLFIQNAEGTRKIEGVPIADFRLHTGNYTFGGKTNIEELAQTLGLNANKQVTLEDLRKAGIATNTWVATYGENYVLVPFNYAAHNEFVQAVFAGKNLTIKN